MFAKVTATVDLLHSTRIAASVVSSSASNEKVIPVASFTMPRPNEESASQ